VPENYKYYLIGHIIVNFTELFTQDNLKIIAVGFIIVMAIDVLGGLLNIYLLGFFLFLLFYIGIGYFLAKIKQMKDLDAIRIIGIIGILKIIVVLGFEYFFLYDKIENLIFHGEFIWYLLAVYGWYFGTVIMLGAGGIGLGKHKLKLAKLEN